MRKFLLECILILVTSFYFFDFTMPFLPPSINTKILVGIFGIFAFVYDSIRKREMSFSVPMLFATLLAFIFSVWCLFSVTVNDIGGDLSQVYTTSYTEYTEYFISFATWMAGAYGVCAALRWKHEEVTLDVLVYYLVWVGVFQCVMALLIDNVGPVDRFVDKIYRSTAYYKASFRMYGLGAALDPAGVRFSVILILIAQQISDNPHVRTDRRQQAFYLAAFVLIFVVGSVISRTTGVGAVMGIGYMAISMIRLHKGGLIPLNIFRSFFRFLLVLIFIILLVIYLYRTNDTFHGYLRFGLEGFFNWVETGEFRTSSTDILMNQMWIWPEDARTWLIGRGTFGIFQNRTDIGFCNFILYCGTIGLLIFSVFFVYCHFIQNRKFRNFQITSWLFTALTFIIWIKVTTDIFFIDALLFWLAGDKIAEAQ